MLNKRFIKSKFVHLRLNSNRINASYALKRAQILCSASSGGRRIAVFRKYRHFPFILNGVVKRQHICPLSETSVHMVYPSCGYFQGHKDLSRTQTDCLSLWIVSYHKSLDRTIKSLYKTSVFCCEPQ